MFGIIIDKNGFKIDFVQLLEDNTPCSYKLNEGERIIETDWAIANGMNKPQWDGEKWTDTEPLPLVEPPMPQPTVEEQLAESNKRVVSVEAAMAQLAMQTAKNTLLK